MAKLVDQPIRRAPLRRPSSCRLPGTALPLIAALSLIAALALAGCVTDGDVGTTGLGASAEAGRIESPPAGRMAAGRAAGLDAPALFVAGPAPTVQWSDVLSRHRRALAAGQDVPPAWTALVRRLRDLDLPARLAAANAEINRYPYIRSERNWGRGDYWAAPFELMAKGGQCQDFAVAKYLLLRATGVPSERLRVALVQDGRSGLAHAVLLAEVQGQMLVLDNQEPEVVPASSLHHYGPLYALSETGWWLYDGQVPRDLLPAAGFDRGSFGQGS